MELNVIHLLLYANPKVNGLKNCVTHHMDCWFGYTEQQIEIEDDIDDPMSYYSIIKRWGIHTYYAIEPDKNSSEQIQNWRDLYKENQIIMDLINERRHECTLFSKQIEMFEKQFNINYDDKADNVFIMSIPLSDFEYGWWKGINARIKEGKITKEDGAMEHAKVLLRGMITVRDDIFTFRTDDPDGRLYYNIMTGDDNRHKRYIAKTGKKTADILNAMFCGTAIVDSGTRIYPMATGIVHPAEMWELYRANRRYVKENRDLVDDDEASPYRSDAAIIAAIDHEPYAWDYWRQRAADNKSMEKLTYFKFGIRRQYSFDTWMVPLDYERCEDKEEYPSFLSDDEDDGKPIINSWFCSSGQLNIILDSDWFNYIYETHCEKNEVEYDDFWPDTIDEDNYPEPDVEGGDDM